MNHIYFENIPDDLLQYIFEYYMIGFRHRINLRKMKELIEFTQGKLRTILKEFCSDVILVMQQANVSREAIRALTENEGERPNLCGHIKWFGSMEACCY